MQEATPDPSPAHAKDAAIPALGWGRTVTPRGLLAVVLLGCLVGAVFGAKPLAAWVPAVPLLPEAADTWQSLTTKFGLDRPYDWLRQAMRDAEAAR